MGTSLIAKTGQTDFIWIFLKQKQYKGNTKLAQNKAARKPEEKEQRYENKLH